MGDMFSGRQLTLFFNLLYKAMKYDTDTGRVSAFSKRLLHTVLHRSPSIVCGSLFLFSEIVRCHPELRGEGGATASRAIFDPAKREPRAAFSGTVTLTENMWELSLLAHHFHPSVSMFTAGSSGEISYSGDPLKDFSLSPFLDKIAFKNPKSFDRLSKQLKRGKSVAERKSGLSGNLALPMNDPSHLESNRIAAEEEFFHRFFVERAKRDGIKGIVRGGGADKEKEDSELEDEALNATEADEADDMVDDLEGDTDSEEEAFVNQLAEKLMESTANGKANLDEEDPEMDDWSDFDDSDSEQENRKLEDEEDSDGDGSEQSFVDAFSNEDSDGENGFNLIEGEDSVGDGLLFGSHLGEDGSDDGSERQSSKRGNNRQKKRKNSSTSIYADAEEYDKILNDSTPATQQDLTLTKASSTKKVQDYDDEADPEMAKVDRTSRKKKQKKGGKKH